MGYWIPPLKGFTASDVLVRGRYSSLVGWLVPQFLALLERVHVQDLADLEESMHDLWIQKVLWHQWVHSDIESALLRRLTTAQMRHPHSDVQRWLGHLLRLLGFEPPSVALLRTWLAVVLQDPFLDHGQLLLVLDHRENVPELPVILNLVESNRRLFLDLILVEQTRVRLLAQVVLLQDLFDQLSDEICLLVLILLLKPLEVLRRDLLLLLCLLRHQDLFFLLDLLIGHRWCIDQPRDMIIVIKHELQLHRQDNDLLLSWLESNVVMYLVRHVPSILPNVILQKPVLIVVLLIRWYVILTGFRYVVNLDQESFLGPFE